MRTFKNLDEIQSIHPLILQELGKNFLNERSYVLSPQVYQEIGIYYVAKLNGLSLETVGAVTVESLRSLLCFYCLSPKPNLTKSYNKQWEKNYLKTGVEQYQRREAVLNQFLPENYNTTSAMFTLDNWHNKLINSSEKKSLEHRNFILKGTWFNLSQLSKKRVTIKEWEELDVKEIETEQTLIDYLETINRHLIFSEAVNFLAKASFSLSLMSMQYILNYVFYPRRDLFFYFIGNFTNILNFNEKM